jgi:ribosomal-protein-alanine N-acetyltransferase
MKDVYAEQPSYENELVLLRPITSADVPALLNCYADPYAAPFFNADNCNGDDFRYRTPERMAEAIAFWERSYRNHEFVRWAVEDQSTKEVAGTVEMFHRLADDEWNHMGVLRIDLWSRYETRAFVYALTSLCLRHFYDAFEVETILTKAVPQAAERVAALTAAGFAPLDVGMCGYPHYYERKK